MKGCPASLYVTTVRHVAKNFDRFATLDLSRHLTESMRFDVYWDLFKASASTTTTTLREPHRKVRRRLIRDFGRFDVFFALLNVGHRRMQLHGMFQVRPRFLSQALIDLIPSKTGLVRVNAETNEVLWGGGLFLP